VGKEGLDGGVARCGGVVVVGGGLVGALYARFRGGRWRGRDVMGEAAASAGRRVGSHEESGAVGS
jgi:hypothetical protein